MAPVGIGIATLFIPLVHDFHIESAIIASAIGAYWAGISATRPVPRGMDLQHALKILGALYLAGLPLLFYALLTGCYTVHGLGFWLFLPGPSVFLGYGVGRLIRFFRLPFPKLCTVLVLLLITFGGWLYEFVTFPQLYFFNHIWGYWPGPIYDEAIRFPLSLVGFRFFTLCWILIIWLIPFLNEDRLYRWIIGLASLGLVFGYTQLEKMRIITPQTFLKQQLGGEIETDHARIYYAKEAFSDAEIDRLGMETEFYISQIQDALQINKPDSTEKIELYIYADPWQKKQLVGAKYTSYVTVWQQVPQVHIAKEQLNGSLKHEVVHAATALLEWPGLLPNIGLTEGVAVALDPDRSPRSTIDQLVAASKPYPSAEQMESSLSYWGFYTARSPVSYTTAGSFVRYLLESRPPKHFVTAFQCGSVAEGYSEPFPQLIDGWHQKLDSVRIDSSDRRRASDLFGRPSIFEQRCPHKVPRAGELFDQFLLSDARGDTATAINALAELKRIDTTEYAPKLLWMLWNLKAGNAKAVIDEANMEESRIEVQLLTADAYRMSRQWNSSEQHLYRALELAKQQSDTTFDESFAARLDSLQWQYDLRVRLEEAVLDSSQFERAFYRQKMRAVENLLKSNELNSRLFKYYATQLAELPIDMDYFSTYLSLIHRSAYQGYIEIAKQWIHKLSQQELSLRYQERLQQQFSWVEYIHRD